MAKKKEVKDTEPISSVSSIGNVKIKVARGNTILKEYKFKNTATNLLFHGIALGLVGGYASGSLDSYLPQYIGIGYVESGLNPTTKDQTDLQAYSGTAIGPRIKLSSMNVYGDTSNGKYTAPFSVTIPYSSIISANTEGKINELGLFSTLNTKSLLARIYFSSDPIVVTSGTSLIVEWDISIQSDSNDVDKAN